MLFQNWLKTLIVNSAPRSSRRDRRKARSASGHVVSTREEFACAPIVETLEVKTLLSANPELVADLVAGAGGSNPSQFVNVNGTLFFRASDSTNGQELWRSDGTVVGTTLVKDINSGSSNSYPNSLTNVNGTLFFQASDGTNGYELWQSDGTAAGTILVKDLYTGSSGSYPFSLTNVNGTLFFRGTDGTNGNELWKSDGTSAGTTLVKDIRTGSSSSNPGVLTNVNGTLFFYANDGTNGEELWQSDGTAAGTTLVKDIYSGSSDSYPRDLTNVNGTLFFKANDGTNGSELWQSDGTSAGTTLVKDIRIGSSGSLPISLANVNGTLFFNANDGTNGQELWQSDGTDAGTTLVKDINSGSLSSYARYLTNVNGTLFFIANDGLKGTELWQSDGTDAGTTLVADIRVGGSTSSPSSLTNVNGTLFFQANDGTTGKELWKADIPADSPMVKQPTVSVSAFSFLPPALVKDILAGSSSSYSSSLTNVNGTLFFQANDGTTGYELWRSDGTDAGTTLVKDIISGSSSGSPNNLTNVNGTLFFKANDGTNGYELWRSDGTDAGTTLVKDIYSGSTNSHPTELVNVNGTLFFQANDGTNGKELWQSDGTEAGTTLVKDIHSGSNGSSPRDLTNVNGTLFFRANNGTNGDELWQSDGTEAGTTLVKDINGGGSSSPSFLTNVNGTLFFRAHDGANGIELWKSDGTDAGTTLVKDINTGSSHSAPRNMTNVNGTLFFQATDGTNGYELWRSDGTEAGTTLVKDIYSGSDSSYPSNLTNVNGTLFFRANEGINGGELWQSDGTNAGTTLVNDIYTGISGSYPYSLANVNGTLFFQANDGTNGYELWSMVPGSAPMNAAPTISSLSPADDATDVAVGENLVVTFSDNVQKGTGNILIKRTSDDTIFATIDVTDAHVSVSGAAVTINPTADLESLTGYYVQIAATAITDTSENAFAGISDTTTWNFTTAAPANASPTITVGDLNYTEGDNFGNGVQIDAAATLNDADGDGDWDGGTLTIQMTTNAEATDEISIADNLVGTINTFMTSLRDGATVIGTLSAAEGTVTGGTTLTITFNANATNARVQDVLRAISYRTVSDTPSESPRTVTFVATDKNSGSANDTATINVTDAPESVSMLVSAHTGSEAAGTMITVTAVASGNVTGDQTLTVSASGPGITSGDYVFSSTTITILSGQSMGSVTFTILDDAVPEFTETATLEFSNPSSGIVLGLATHQDVDIVDNDSAHFDFVKNAASTAPGFTPVLGSNIYSAAAGFGWVAAPGTATETYDTGVNKPDELLRDYHFIRTGSKTFRVDLPDGDYDVSIDIGSKLHSFTNEAVYVDGVLVDTVTTTAGNFAVASPSITTTGGKLLVTIARQGGTIIGINALTILRSNGTPLVTTTATTLSYSAGDPGTAVDPGLTVSDSDSTDLTGAVVRIIAGHAPSEDLLEFTDQLGITGSFVGATGVLTLTGTSSVANYEAALRSVAYRNSSGTPTLSSRTVEFEVNDGANTASATRTVQVGEPASRVTARFDFNLAAAANTVDYTSILTTTIYSSAVGYGWASSSAVESFDTGSGSTTDLQRDYHFLRTGSRTFRVDVPNGQYDVTYTTGSTVHKFTNVGVSINGTQVDTVTTGVNEFLPTTYTVSVTNGRIEFTIERLGGTIAAISGLMIAPTSPPLLAAPGFAKPIGLVHSVTTAELQSIVEQAVGVWTATGLSTTEEATLKSVNFQIANLPGNRLGDASRSLIRIDDDANGYGWSLNGTNSLGSMDLLTVVLHELGHVLGHDDDYDPDHSGDIMSGYLAPSQTRTLQPVESALLPSLDNLFSLQNKDDELSLFGLL